MVSAITAAPNLRARRHPGGGRRLAVLEIDRVQDRLAAAELERRLEHRQLGGIDHQRAVDLAAHARRRPRSSRRPRRGRRRRCRCRARCCPRAPARGPWRRSRPSRRLPAARGISSSRWRCSARRWPGTTLSWRSGTAENSEVERRRVLRGAGACGARPVAVLGDPAQHRVQGLDVLDAGAAAAADDVDRVLGDEALGSRRRARPARSG